MKIAAICATGSGASACPSIGVRDYFCELLWVAEGSAAFLSVPPSSIPIGSDGSSVDLLVSPTSDNRDELH